MKADWTRIREAVNVAGSLASITGISLVWLKTTSPNSNLTLAVPAFFIASLFALGTITVAYLMFQWGYRTFAIAGSTAAKVAYVSFALGLLLIGVWIALAGIYAFAMVTIHGSYQP